MKLSKFNVAKATGITGAIATPTGLYIDKLLNGEEAEYKKETELLKVSLEQNALTIKGLEAEKEDIQANLNQSLKQLSETEQRLKNLQEEYDMTNDWVSGLEAKIVYWQNETAKYKKLWEDALSEITKKLKEYEDLFNEFETIRSSNTELLKQLQQAKENETVALSAYDTMKTALTNLQAELKAAQQRLHAHASIFTLKDILDLDKVKQNIDTIRTYISSSNPSELCVEYSKTYNQITSRNDGTMYTNNKPFAFCRNDFDMGNRMWFDNVYNWVKAQENKK